MSQSALSKIMVAPNGARRTRADHPALPETIEQTVETAKACFAAGAGAIHAHVRDDQARHVLDVGRYRELLAELKIAVPDMQVQITTEAVGRYTPEQQRTIVHEVMPDHVSVAPAEMVGESDFSAGQAGFVAARPQVKTLNSQAQRTKTQAREFYHWAAANNIQIQHLLYSPQQVFEFSRLLEDGTIPDHTPKLLYVLGRYAAQQESQPEDLQPFLTQAARCGLQADWAICAFGHRETACLSEALKRGGKVRVGFENGLWNANGSLAKDNAERVREIAALPGVFKKIDKIQPDFSIH